jgi:hypothetical protein
MGTLVPALVGGVLGYAYAKLAMTLPEDSSWPAIYGAAGSAVMVLSIRLAAMFRAMWNEFRRNRPG